MEKVDLSDVSELITESEIIDFERDGHVCIRGLSTPEEIGNFKPFNSPGTQSGRSFVRES